MANNIKQEIRSVIGKEATLSGDKIKEILSKAHKKYNTYFYPTIRALENFGYSMQRKKIGGHFMYVVKLDTLD